MGSAKRILGGLLFGGGEGLLEKAKADRITALAKFTSAETEKRAVSAHERSKGLLQTTESDTQGNLFGITKGGDTTDLGIKTPLTRSPGSLTDLQQVNLAVDSFTEGKGSFDGEKTNWKDASDLLIENGRDDLARRIQSLKKMVDEGVDITSDKFAKAEEMATELAADRNPPGPDFLRGDAVKEAYGGKTEKEWIFDMAFEILRKGEAASSPSLRTSAPAGAMQGSGTETDPYRPTTKEELDSVPSGEIYWNPADGKPYRKN